MPAATPAFVHLRVHSPFSLLEGAATIERLVSLCVADAMPAMAITDTGNMFGVLEFSQASASQGVQPIVGTLMALRREGHPPREADEAERVVLLARNEAGYGELLDLVSASHLESESGQVASLAIEALAGRSDGLICLAGGAAGPVGRRLLEGRPAEAEAVLRQLADIFTDRLYVELQRHGMEEERRTEAGLLQLAYATGLPLIATNDVMFADAAMHEAHDALLCIAGGGVSVG